MTPRNEATWSCCTKYAGERKFDEYNEPIRSSATMQPNAASTTGSIRWRVPTRTARSPPLVDVEPIFDPK